MTPPASAVGRATMYMMRQPPGTEGGLHDQEDADDRRDERVQQRAPGILLLSVRLQDFGVILNRERDAFQCPVSDP